MAENAVLNATARAGTGKGAARAARREGQVPGVIYGGGDDPQAINVKFNELLKRLHAGKFMATLLTVSVEGKEQRVICRAVQRDKVNGMPEHVDFLRLSPRSRINLYIPVEFVGEENCRGLKRGGVLTVTRPEVELKVTAGNIPEKLVADVGWMNIGDTLTISNIEMPQGARPMIADRDFVIANIQPPSGLGGAGDDEEESTETETTEMGPDIDTEA